MGAKQLRKEHHVVEDSYQNFDNLNGNHPWMQAVPEGYVTYRVRELGVGEIGYFNFALARQMGLIAQDHPDKMTGALKAKLLKTFSVQIINEFDELKKTQFDPATIKPNKYMASRYLQLQHTNKQGKTSGDGRGIWNGIVQNENTIWDVSSRGTGVTCLAPGSVEANRPLKTGAGEFGYGCGLAEIDELYSAAILAEIFHLQGIETERVLCIIDHGRGYGIGVRAAKNLLRPAHLFLYLKQNRIKDLKASVDYFIYRQKQNGRLKTKFSSPTKYDDLLQNLSKDFAHFVAQLEVDYIFAWLDWDGDNVLMDAGIIDYGSVRQFGSRHDKYRYDDIERFSTSLGEQKNKARLIVQVFAQMVDYLKTEKKKSLTEFSKHPVLNLFDHEFKKERAHRMLYRIGFDQTQRAKILKNKSLFESFDKEFCYFEKAKISGNTTKVSDGINHPPLFNIRNLIKELSTRLEKQGLDFEIKDEEVFQTMLSSFAKRRDTKMRAKHRAHIQNFIRLYKMMIAMVTSGKRSGANCPAPATMPSEIASRGSALNRQDRITGNALIQVVSEILQHVKKGMPISKIQGLIDQLIFMNMGMPEVEDNRYYIQKPRVVQQKDLLEKLLQIIHEYSDDI